MELSRNFFFYLILFQSIFYIIINYFFNDHETFLQQNKMKAARMYMGVQPSPVDCPIGSYRKIKGGITIGECTECPKGVYGETTGLITSTCTALCPKGTYNDRPGAKGLADCKLCPPGVYGSSEGLTSSACSGPCPLGKYSNTPGLKKITDCMDCPPGYRGSQGRRGNNFAFRNAGGSKCDTYIKNGKVITGKDKDASRA